MLQLTKQWWTLTMFTLAVLLSVPAKGQTADSVGANSAGDALVELGVESVASIVTQPEGSLIKADAELVADEGMIVDVFALHLTLEAIESMALAASPTIRRATALVHAARGRALQAGLGRNPEVGIDFQQLGSDGIAEQYGVAISQEIIRPRKLSLDRSIVLHEVKQLNQELAAERQRVRTDAGKIYIRAVRAQRQLELTAQLVEIGEKGAQIASELLRAREVSRADVLQAELEVESAKVLDENARNAQLAVWRELAALAGRTAMEPQPIRGDMEQDPARLVYEEALFQLQSQSPEIAAVLAKIQRARCQLQRQLIENQPDVTLSGLVNWRDNGIGGGSDGAVIVSVPIPIWNQNQGAITEARHQLAAAQHELQRVERSLAHRLAPIFERYSNAAHQVESFRTRILPRANETLNLTRQSYELGEISFVNLLTVQRTYANNQLAYLDAMESLRLAEIEIAGQLLSGSLSARQ